MPQPIALDRLKFSVAVKPVFDFHALRAGASGEVGGDFGTPVPARCRVALAIELSGDFLCEVSERPGGLNHVRVVRRSPSRCVRVRASAGEPREVDALALAILGADRDSDGHAGAAARLSDSIHEAALAALERRVSASLAAPASQEPLIDCRFLSGEARDSVPAGDFSRAAELTCSGLTTDDLHLELHLPLIPPAPASRFDLLAAARAETDEDGRIVVYARSESERAEERNRYQSVLTLFSRPEIASCRFTLAHTDRRTLGWGFARSNLSAVLRACGLGPEIAGCLDAGGDFPSGPVDVSFALSLPGKCAAAWFDAPDLDSEEFFPVYSAVSKALQRLLRAWVPYLYFSEASRCASTAAAIPLLVYRATPLCKGQPKYLFTHDVVHEDSPLFGRVTLLRALSSQMGAVREHLRAAGAFSAAVPYSPDRAARSLAALRRRPRLLNALLVSDGMATDAFLRLGLAARKFRKASARNPQKALKRLSRFAGDSDRRMARNLRRLYPGLDCSSAGSLLLIGATRALNAALGRTAPLDATLRLTAGRAEWIFRDTA